MKTQKRMLLLAVLLAARTAQAAITGFNQTAAGPWDYNTLGNWADSTINGIWDGSLILSAPQTVTFDADTSLSTGLTFNYLGNNALTLTSADTTSRSITLGGNIGVDTASGTLAAVTFGSSANPLNVNLGGATCTMTVATNRTLAFLDVMSNGGIIKAGPGTLLLGNTFTKVVSNTNASPTVAMADTSNVQVGMWISGIGIPAGTYITAINPNVDVTLSANATSFNVGLTATLWNTSTYSGDTTISAGILKIGGVGVNVGSTIIGSPTGTGNVTLGGGTSIDNSGSGNLWHIPTLTLSGDIYSVGGNRLQINVQTLDLGGGNPRKIYVNSKNRQITTSGGTSTTSSETTGNCSWEFNSALGQLTIRNGTLDLETTAWTGGNGGYYGAFRLGNSATFVNFTNNSNLIVGNAVVLMENGSFTSANAPRLTISTNAFVDALGADTTVYSLSGGGTYALSLLVTAATPRTLYINGASGTAEFTGLLQDGSLVGATLKVAKTGASTQILSSANPYTGGTILAGANGTLIANHATALGAAGAPIYIGTANGQACGTLQFNVAPGNAHNVSFGGVAGNLYANTATIQLNYAGSPTTATLGKLNLGQQNTLSITAGPLASSSPTPSLSFAASGNIFGYSGTSKSATIVPLGVDVSIGALTASNSVNAQTSTLILDGTSAGNQITGAISDSGSGSTLNKGVVIKQNTSTWKFSGLNTYTGSTSLKGGGLTLDYTAGNNILNPASALILGSGATAAAAAYTLTLNGAADIPNTQAFGVSSTAFTPGMGHINLVPGSGTGTLTLQLGIADRGQYLTGHAYEFNLPPGSTLYSAAPNTFNGLPNNLPSTYSTAGVGQANTWAVSGATRVGAGANATTAASGNVVTLTGATAPNNGQQVNFTVVPTGSTLSQFLTYYVVNRLSDTQFSLSLSLGGNAVTLGNSTVNGTLYVEGQVTGLSSYSTSYSTASVNLDVGSGGTLTANPNSLRFNANSAATVTLAANAIRAVASGGILVTPAVGANLSQITGGILQGRSRRDIQVFQNNTSEKFQIDSIIDDIGGGTSVLAKSGYGTLLLTANNGYSGNTYVHEGTLVAAGSALPDIIRTATSTASSPTLTGMSDTSGIFIGQEVTQATYMSTSVNTTWIVTAITPNTSVTLSSSAGISTSPPGTSFTFRGTGCLGTGGTVAVAPGATLQIGNAGSSGSLYTNQTIVNSGTVILNRSDAGLSLTNVISGSGSIVQAGSGTVTLNGTNTFTGATSVNSGTLSAGNDLAFGTNSVNLTGGNLGGASGTWSIANTVNVQSNASIDTVGMLILTGELSGNGNLTKTGTGTLLLNGSKTGTGTFTVSSGVLGGTGTLEGTVTNQATLTAADTNSVGILTIANLVMAPTSTLIWNCNATTQDVIQVTGQLTLPTVATVIVSEATTGDFDRFQPPILFTFGSGPSDGMLLGWSVTGAHNYKPYVKNNQVILKRTWGTLISVY